MSTKKKSKEMVECGWCEREVPIEETFEKQDTFFGGTFRICKECKEDE